MGVSPSLINVVQSALLRLGLVELLGYFLSVSVLSPRGCFLAALGPDFLVQTGLGLANLVGLSKLPSSQRMAYWSLAVNGPFYSNFS